VKIGATFIPPSIIAAGGDSLVLRGDALLLDKLTLGQIIKGRVLRSYEGQRYSMSFEGQERIVDSAVPLRTGDLVHGRVVGLGERIELQRVAVESGETSRGEAAPQQRALPADDPVAELFARYQASLAPEDARELQRAVSRAALPDLMTLSGLILSKLNLRMAPEFLRAVYGALSRGARGGAFALSGAVPEIQIESSQDGQDAASREAFASLISRIVMDVPESRWRDDAELRAKSEGSPAGATPEGVQDAADGLAPGSGRAGGDGGFDLARWILNAQNGGAVAHRVGTLPLLIDGRLVELDVALFEEPPGEEGQASHIRHRRVLLAMDTATLGRIEASALFAADHIRVTLSTSSSESTGALARHMGPLTAELEHAGWHVDEMKYETRAPVAPGEVMNSVVEHLIGPGSVSRLV